MPARRLRFEHALVLIAACALALRVYYTLGIAHNLQGPGDFYFYHWSANLLADNRGYIDPFSLAYSGTIMPTAMHPPLWPFLLSVVSWFGGAGATFGHQGGHDYFAHRLTGGVCGTITVVLVAYLARRVAGARVGIVAGVVGAIYPILIVADGSPAIYVAMVASASSRCVSTCPLRTAQVGNQRGVADAVAPLDLRPHVIGIGHLWDRLGMYEADRLDAADAGC